MFLTNNFKIYLALTIFIIICCLFPGIAYYLFILLVSLLAAIGCFAIFGAKTLKDLFFKK